MTYKCEFKFSYSDMESKQRLFLGDAEIDLDDSATLLNAKDERIAELEKAQDFILSKVGFDGRGFYLPCGNSCADKEDSIKSIKEALKEQDNANNGR